MEVDRGGLFDVEVGLWMCTWSFHGVVLLCFPLLCCDSTIVISMKSKKVFPSMIIFFKFAGPQYAFNTLSNK